MNGDYKDYPYPEPTLEERITELKKEKDLFKKALFMALERLRKIQEENQQIRDLARLPMIDYEWNIYIEEYDTSIPY